MATVQTLLHIIHPCRCAEDHGKCDEGHDKCAGPAVRSICGAIMRLFTLRQHLVTSTATAVLSALLASPAARLQPPEIAALLQGILAAESAWESKDVDVLLSLSRTVESGFIRSAPCLARTATTPLLFLFNKMNSQTFAGLA